jgi:hypothetical protein
MTRKEFVLNVVEEIKASPRAILAGHGLPAAVLQTIAARPDVMAKLAVALYSTKLAKKGAKGLKKSPTLRILGYKNFMEFQGKAREDIEAFIGGLPEADQASFTNSDNILGVIMLPDTRKTGEETTESEIVAGKSVPLVFDHIIRKDYGIAGALYFLVLIGESAVRPAEEKLAARKEKVNKKKQSRRTPAKVKAEMKAKANKKLEMLNKRRAELQQTAFSAEMQLEQYGEVVGGLGANPQDGRSVSMTMRHIDKKADKIAGVIASLSPDDKKAYTLAAKYWNKGEKVTAKRLLKTLNNPLVTQIVTGESVTAKGAPITSSAIMNERKAKLKGEIARLTAKNETFLAELSTTVDVGRKRSIQSMISKNNAAIRALRAKLGTYKNMSPKAMRNKAEMLKTVHEEIEANIAMGASIKEALDSALAAIDAKDAEKAIIKQQVMQQVASGAPMQFVVQQAIQENIGTPKLGSSNLSGISSIEDVLNTL